MAKKGAIAINLRVLDVQSEDGSLTLSLGKPFLYFPDEGSKILWATEEAISEARRGDLEALRDLLELGADLRKISAQEILSLANESAIRLDCLKLVLEHTQGCDFINILHGRIGTEARKWHQVANALNKLLTAGSGIFITKTLQLFKGQDAEVEEFAKHFVQNSLTRGYTLFQILQNIQKSTMMQADPKLDGSNVQLGLSLCEFVLSKLINTKSDGSTTLFLDLSTIGLSELGTLAETMRKLEVKVTEVSVDNLMAAIVQKPGVKFIEVIADYLARNYRNDNPHQAISEINQDKLDSLKSSLSIISKGAEKINFPKLPLICTPLILPIFQILEGIKCHELKISQDIDGDSCHQILGANKLCDLMATNKDISVLDISDFNIFLAYEPWGLKSDRVPNLIVKGCNNNPALKVKYSNPDLDYLRYPDICYQPILDFSQTRMKPYKKDYIKCLLQVAHMITSTDIEVKDVLTKPGEETIKTLYIPQEIVNFIMKEHVLKEHLGLFNYMEALPFLKADGMHILPGEVSLLGLPDTPDSNPA